MFTEHASNAPSATFHTSFMATLGIGFAVMLVALNQTIVGTALPAIVADLRGFNLYAWVATSYLLTSMITIPIFGRFGDHFGRKPFLIAAIIIFCIASALCGSANSMLMLVLARGLQGIGGGMLIGTAFAAIADLFPDARVRLRWQVIVSAAFGIATALGPLLGGLLAGSWGWRWVFYADLPIGILSLFFVVRYVPFIRHIADTGKFRFDWFGILLIIIALCSLQLFIETVPKKNWGYSIMLIFICAIAFLVLWKWEQRAKQPIVPLEIMRNQAIFYVFLLAIVAGVPMFSILIYASLLFQGGFGLSPLQAGLLLTPLAACISVASIVNSRLVARGFSSKTILYTGFIFLALSCLGIMLLHQGIALIYTVIVMLLGGFGLGLVLSNLTVCAQLAADREHLGIVTALLQSLRTIGGALGTAMTGILITQRYGLNIDHTFADAHVAQWITPFKNPEILINHDNQLMLSKQLLQAGYQSATLFQVAREALVNAIHIGIIPAIVITLIGLWIISKMPLVRLDHLNSGQ